MDVTALPASNPPTVNLTQQGSAILCCVGSGAHSEQQVRLSAALATDWGCRWHVVTVQARGLERKGSMGPLQSSKALHLAAHLGARVDLLYSEDIVDALVHYARDQAITTLVIGPTRRRLASLRRATLAHSIGERAPELDVRIAMAHQIEGTGIMRRGRATPIFLRAGMLTPAIGIALVLGAVLLQGGDALQPPSVSMLMVFAVAMVALSGGRRAAAVTTVANLLIYDFLIIPPVYSFAIKDGQALVTFLVMLIVGLTIGELTARLRYQAKIALARERHAYALSAFSRNLSAQAQEEHVLRVGAQTVAKVFGAKVAILILDDAGNLSSFEPVGDGQTLDMGLAQRALREGRGCGHGTRIEPRHEWLMVPLKTSMKNRGVLALHLFATKLPSSQLHEIETFAALISLALERVHYVRLAQEALLGVESERLRSSLLAALSHDLQTPLASVVGLADSILLTRPRLSQQQQEIASAIVEEGQRMSRSVGNLLEMAKLEAGTVRLRTDWHSIEEVIGTALSATKRRMAARHCKVVLPSVVPLVKFDAALMERVLINLLDNAAKYTAGDAHIELAVTVHQDALEITVTDDGPGLPPGREEALFAKFARGRSESAGSGVGLGLAICRAILVAHGGRIVAEAGRSLGARFIMTLPLSDPPFVATELESLPNHA